MQLADLRPGIIQYFFKHSIIDGGKKYTLVLPVLTSFIVRDQFMCGSGNQFPQVWCANEFDSFGAASFLPVQRLMGKFVSGYNIVKGEQITFVMPLAKKFKL